MDRPRSPDLEESCREPKKQKIKNLKIIQDRLLFTSSCYRDLFQFFIGYNLLIQIAGSEASSFAVSSEDIDKERSQFAVQFWS